ncbi:hypothetical protein D3C76_1265990 [compost metagenome]
MIAEHTDRQLLAVAPLDCTQYRLRGRYPFAETWWRRVAFVHVDFFDLAAAVAGAVDDLREQGCQAHVAIDFQAAAGEKLFNVGLAGHDADEVRLRHADGHVRLTVAPGGGDGRGLDFGPVRKVGAELELKDAFDADRGGIGEQIGQHGLQVHGIPSSNGVGLKRERVFEGEIYGSFYGEGHPSPQPSPQGGEGVKLCRL